MEIQTTPIEGLLILVPKVFPDCRGYFFETYNTDRYNDAGLSVNFVQDNESKSTRGVIRGLHYQLNPFSQGKLVRVIDGIIFDVAVDLRKNSLTFGQWFGIELTDENKKQLFIPRGFAHGISVLSEYAIFSYKCDQYYNPQLERGILYNDEELGIDWKIPASEVIISEKDLKNKPFREAEINF